MTEPGLQLEMGDAFKPQPFEFYQHPTPGPFYRFVVPWEYCISDNNRFIPTVIPGARGRKPRGKLTLSPDYRDAKQRIRPHFANRWGDQPVLTQPVFLFGYLLVPDYRETDSGNYRKLITDCFTGTVYRDDSQIHDERWKLAGLSRGNPRIEIVLGVIPDPRLQR
jgi:Holliday junction resolvase RusA-like endonuclease